MSTNIAPWMVEHMAAHSAMWERQKEQFLSFPAWLGKAKTERLEALAAMPLDAFPDDFFDPCYFEYESASGSYCWGRNYEIAASEVRTAVREELKRRNESK